ncbi:uncharacterized protein LOC133532700 [Cydia pomonella]|uniref:uncharacterized protein LOC133532700 n=1 Tax=Cydia pomonella TaxID=82600 RepID=UPI002ADE1E13|nr:uncharacterized protein LOC133532406 isoform X1 [Cydia pomonella]XP_061727036.1 uncharacterized protein LOC133532406 isoform X1 [Cydia pomonella]XP_061727037.1 uncharacterized protein LOC133532406 isoform X1 [Cydia pomonella]XP_061727456.1 uncharacterized protein LOC133532700 [Cydia pomonella]XP_061727457.1 uncharacterized protein LOC133532700 [Cydia pomonella]XP_061727458.1 uncharacterized protein LOC133532700 [Cydia pomonella]
MASKQIDIKTILEQFQKDVDYAISESSKKNQAHRSSDSIHGTTSDIRNENVGKITRTVTSKRLCDAKIEQEHNSDLKRPKRMSINDSELKFRCSFCSARFPSLTIVRDHTRACHRDENERRREGKSNHNSTKLKSVVGNGTTGSKLYQHLEKKSTFLFRCNACKFASVSYNHIIEHCQYHVVTSENPEVFVSRNSTRKCVISNAEFDVDFDTYNECKYGSDYAYTLIYCDYNLLKQDKWPGIVDDLPKPEIDMINCNSIYYFTRIVRLTSRKKVSSAPFMIFQCEKCLKYIDPHSVLAHVVENSCNKELAEFPCYECKRPFLDENTMYLHYKMHQAAVSSNMKFRTVFFNHKDDDFFNALLLKAAGVIMQNVLSRKKNALQKLLSDDAKAQLQVKISPAANILKANEHGLQNGPSGSNFPQLRLSCDKAKTQIQVKMSPQAKDVQKVTEGTSQNVPDWSKLARPTLSSDIIKTQENNSIPVKDIRKITELTQQNAPSSQLQRLLTSGAAKEPIQLKIVLERHDARSLLIPGTTIGVQNKTVSSKITSNIAKDTDKATTVYKCQCDLSFHELEYMFRHLGKCPSEKSARISCVCGLVFDEQQYQLHYGIHIQGFTKLNVKRITMCDEKILGINNKVNEKEKRELDYNQLCNKAISELINIIQNVASSLPHIRKIKTEVKEKIIENETRSAGSGDDLITKAMKSQGTMTERETLKSVGTDTNDLNISVLKSQGTMAMIGVQTVHEKNNELCNRKQVINTKLVCLGTDDLNKSVMKWHSQAQTSVEVNKEFSNTQQAGDTKSVDSVSDDLCISVMKSQSKIAIVVPEIQTAYAVNEVKNNMKDDAKTMLVRSGAGDMKTNTEAVQTEMSSSCFELNISNAREENNDRLTDDVNNTFMKPNENLSCGADNTDENQSMVETTIEAETKEYVTNKAQHSNDSTGNICEKNINISDTKHEDHNKTVIKECDQTQKSLNMDQENDAPETQTDNNKEYEKTSETNESENNKDVNETEQGSTDSKIYTEDELLNGPENPEMPIYFDVVEESLVTDDEGLILLYEDDETED